MISSITAAAAEIGADQRHRARAADNDEPVAEIITRTSTGDLERRVATRYGTLAISLDWLELGSNARTCIREENHGSRISRRSTIERRFARAALRARPTQRQPA